MSLENVLNIVATLGTVPEFGSNRSYSKAATSFLFKEAQAINIMRQIRSDSLGLGDWWRHETR